MPLAVRRAVHEKDSVEDHFVYLRGVSWSDYERLMKIRGERSVPRLTYQEGVLELMSPSDDHELIKSLIARLAEVWCLENDVGFTSYGSWTLKNKRRKAGLEPDECWVIGEPPRKKRPDLAIEVIWTSGGLDKLDVYRRLGVPEVWFWRRGRISVHALRGKEYEQLEQSQLLPGIDLVHLAAFVEKSKGEMTSKTIRSYQTALARKRR